MPTKYIFITGGVASSLGKGVTASSIAVLLQDHGFRVRLRKLDPYLNVDPGTMSPYQHGEVYVTEDGAEADLDLGHYERFTGVEARKGDNITSGRIYQDVIKKERKGDYLGATIQVIPHVTDAIKNFIKKDTEDSDILICEIGGTVGDIEGLPFLEAIRQMRNEQGKDNTLFIHLTLLPFIKGSGELKTKPTQHSVKEMLGLGIQPDILVCRSELAMPQAAKRKIALFCNIPEKNVISAYDVRNIYEVPLILKEQNISLIINDFFANDIAGITDTANNPPKLEAWHKIIHNLRNYNNKVKIGVVGKYTSMIDCYKSLDEALLHAGLANNTKVDVRWIDSDTFKNENRQYYQDLEGIIVPGGFGQRGSRGKLKAIEYARENNIPFLGICLGMQLAVIDACQNLANMANATSSELVDEATLEEHIYVISMMKKWQDAQGQTQISATTNDMGGTMRLGSYPCQVMPNTLTAEIYNGATLINERHRHRYEVNLALCQDQLAKQGYVFSGISPDNTLPEIVENRNHRWFIGVQFHPELKSTPHKPHPLFVNFVKNSTKKV